MLDQENESYQIQLQQEVQEGFDSLLALLARSDMAGVDHVEQLVNLAQESWQRIL